MLRRQVPAALALSTLMILAATVGTAAKGDAIVTLNSTLPGDAEPGSEITVGWTVEMPIEGGMAPYSSEHMIIRLIPSTGNPVEAAGQQGPPGHYVATLTVPSGGISDVEVGLLGESCSGGTCQRSDLLFTIDESVVPAISPGTPASVPGANAPGQAPVDTAPPAGAAGDLRGFIMLGLAMAAAAIVVGVLIARDRGRRGITASSSRS